MYNKAPQPKLYAKLSYGGHGEPHNENCSKPYCYQLGKYTSLTMSQVVKRLRESITTNPLLSYGGMCQAQKDLVKLHYISNPAYIIAFNI